MRDVARLILGALVLVALALGVLRPLIKNLVESRAVAAAPELLPAAVARTDERAAAPVAPSPSLAYEQQLVQARSLVTQDPKRVAQVVQAPGWVSNE